MSQALDAPHDPAVDQSIARVEEQFGLLINRVKASMRDRAERVYPGLQPVGYKVLSTVVRAGRLQSGALSEMLMTDKSIISRTVKYLEQVGLITREPDPLDGRSSYVVPTAIAIERMDAVRLDDQEMLYDRLRGWDLGDVERLATLLHMLNEAVPLGGSAASRELARETDSAPDSEGSGAR